LEGLAIGFLYAFDDEAVGADAALARPLSKSSIRSLNRNMNFIKLRRESDETSFHLPVLHASSLFSLPPNPSYVSHQPCTFLCQIARRFLYVEGHFRAAAAKVYRPQYKYRNICRNISSSIPMVDRVRSSMVQKSSRMICTVTVTFIFAAYQSPTAN
jgi:hypothetical protein